MNTTGNYYNNCYTRLMCFSASASFIASASLIALGGASFVAAKKEEKVLAAVPLMFGIQQAFEGIQWLYLNNGSSSIFAGYGFLFFSFIIWPIYSPLFVYILDKQNRKMLKWFVFLGTAVALYSLLVPLTQSLSVRKIGMCIHYGFTEYPFRDLVTTSYLIAVFGPLFFSSKESFKWFGLVFAFFAIISLYFFTVNFVSVWCFFAAMASSTFYLNIKLNNNLIKNTSI